MSTSITSSSDLRGRHAISENAIPENISQQVCNTIQSFAKRKSHYDRETSENLNIFTSGTEYQVRPLAAFKKYENHCYELVQQIENAKPLIAYDFYYRYLRENFNYTLEEEKIISAEKEIITVLQGSNGVHKRCLGK